MTTMSRRAVLATPLAVSMIGPVVAQPATEGFVDAERAILAGRAPVEGGITLDIPTLSENGNSVDLRVSIESAMTAEDHVTAIHVLSDKNPVPRVVTFGLTPRAGRAEVATRIRLATSQTVVALAETSRGQVHRASRDVIVVLGACVETG